jgi:hypothetical protein
MHFVVVLKVVTELDHDFWMTADGSAPPDEPACGFDGQKCNWTNTILIIAGAVLFVLIILGLIFWNYKR